MSKNKRWPFLVTSAVICLLIAGILGMSNILPSYKNTVKEFERAVKSSLLYVSKEDELVIYPWDLFELEEILVQDDTQEEMGTYAWKDLWFKFIEEPYFPVNQSEFYPPIFYSTKNNIYYIKDYEYLTTGGNTCFLSMAVRDDTILYLHTPVKGRAELSLEEVTRADKKIAEQISQSTLLNTDEFNMGFDYDELKKYISKAAKSDNLLDQFFGKPSIYYHQLYDIFSLYIQKYTYFTLSYSGELLCVFNNTSRTGIIFYDPVVDSISGFSIK